MDKSEFKILLMDDEVGEDIKNPPTIALTKLKEEGFTVKETKNMSDVIEWSRKEYFDLYILDIDMSNIDDEYKTKGLDEDLNEDNKRNGSTVAEVLRRISSLKNIVMFSAQGKPKDWLKAANFHFQHYVHKNSEVEGSGIEGSGIEELLEVVNEIFENNDSENMMIPSFKKPEYTDSVVYYDKHNIDNRNRDFGKSKKIRINELNKVKDCILNNNPKLVLLFTRIPPGKFEEYIEYMRDITSLQPKPNVIICLGTPKNADKNYYMLNSDEFRIIELANLHPFRILDCSSNIPEKELKAAIDAGIKWYGENEIFDFPKDEDSYIRPMTDQEIKDILPDDDMYFDEEDWDDDECWDDEEEDDE